MANIDHLLDKCLNEIMHGRASIDDCLRRHPAHADELQPLLAQAMKLRQVELTFERSRRARIRNRLSRHMQQRPRRRATIQQLFTPTRWLRWAAAALATGILALGGLTAVAQASAPGSPLYPVKLASEQAWGVVIGRDADYYRWLGDRRLDEFARLVDTDLGAVALAAYDQSLQDLAEAAGEPISPAGVDWLARHRQQLQTIGLSEDQISELMSPLGGADNESGSGSPSSSATPTPAPSLLPTLPPLDSLLTTPPIP